MLTMTGNKEGRLHVRRQVDDYALRDTEFKSMSFLTYTVETYERQIQERDSGHIEDDNDDNNPLKLVNIYLLILNVPPIFVFVKWRITIFFLMLLDLGFLDEMEKNRQNCFIMLRC